MRVLLGLTLALVLLFCLSCTVAVFSNADLCEVVLGVQRAKVKEAPAAVDKSPPVATQPTALLWEESERRALTPVKILPPGFRYATNEADSEILAVETDIRSLTDFK